MQNKIQNLLFSKLVKICNYSDRVPAWFYAYIPRWAGRFTEKFGIIQMISARKVKTIQNIFIKFSRDNDYSRLQTYIFRQKNF